MKWPIKHNELKAVMMIHSTWIDVELRRAIQTLLDLQSSTAFTSATRDITPWEMICCIFSTSSGSFFFSLVTIETYSENTTIALLYSLATADTVSYVARLSDAVHLFHVTTTSPNDLPKRHAGRDRQTLSVRVSVETVSQILVGSREM